MCFIEMLYVYAWFAEGVDNTQPVTDPFDESREIDQEDVSNMILELESLNKIANELS